MLKGLTQSEYRDLILSIGTHKGKNGRKLSPNEISQLLTKAVEAGASRKDCAKELTVGSTIISAFLKLQKIDTDVRYQADWGRGGGKSIPFSTMSHIANLPYDKHHEAINKILEYSITEKEVRNVVQLFNRSKQSFDDCVKAIVELRPRIEKKYVFIGGITGNSTKKILLSKTQEERDTLIGRVMSKIDRRFCDIHPRLGEKEFSIIADHEITKFFDGSLDDLEGLVNDGLSQEI